MADQVANVSKRSMTRTAFVDDPLTARQFHTNDFVRKPGYRGIYISPYVGKVLWSNVSTGKVMVQWPWGADLESASDLFIDTSADFVPPNYDQSYSSYEGALYTDASPDTGDPRTSSISILAMKWDMAVDRARISVHRAMNDRLSQRAIMKLISAAFPRLGSINISSLVEEEFSKGRRLAIYWKDKKRQYRVTQREKSSGVVGCPRCKGSLRKRTYRYGEQMWLCKVCGFSIHPEDLC